MVQVAVEIAGWLGLQVVAPGANEAGKRQQLAHEQELLVQEEQLTHLFLLMDASDQSLLAV
jgi:hypothetical protein